MKPVVIAKMGTAIEPVRERRGDYETWIAPALALERASVEVVSVFEGERLPEPSDCAGVVVTGSSAMVSERAPWSEAAAAWLADAASARVPVLGICYGHQLLAHALGGVVADNPNGREIGTVEARLLGAAAVDPLLGGCREPALVQTTHVQSVLALPRGARLLARTPQDPHHAFRIDDARGAVAWGVQFHPEFDADVMRGYLEARRAVLAEEGIDADGKLAEVAPTPRGAAVLERFGAWVEGRKVSL